MQTAAVISTLNTGTTTANSIETSAIDKELAIKTILLGELPAMPIVATKVLQLIEDEMVTAEDLAKIVASDPAVAARVLKMTNYSYYGCSRQVTTLSRAIAIIGFNTLKSLVLTASVKEMFKPNGLTGKMLWEQSFGAGLAASIIARRIKWLNPEEAFLTGLLQDIGKIILHHHDQSKFQTVVELYYNEEISFTEAESLVYPFSHAELGGFVLQKWNFPEMLVTAVIHHHSLNFGEEDNCNLRRTAAVACLANLFCTKLGIGERTPRMDLDLPDSRACRMLELGESELTELLDNFAETYERDKEYFS